MSYNSKYTGAQVEKILDSVGGKQDAIVDLDAIRSGAEKGATALQSIPSEYVTETELTTKGYATTSALNDKVDKVSGKGLSTEDFTSALKTKLEGLSSYDDTELSEALSTLRGDFDKLVSGDTTTAIKTFNEVISFLDGIQDTQDLSSIIASIEQQIAGKMDKVTLATVATSGSYNDLSNKPTIPSAVTESTVSGWGFTKNTGTYSKPSTGIPKTDLASTVQTSLGKADTALQSHQDISGKQDILVSGTNIKTINGESILGSGNIRISGGGGGETAPSESGLWLTEVIDNLETEFITPESFVRYIYLNPLESLWFMSENMEYDNYNEYCVVFVSGENMSLTLPGYYSWANGVIPEIEPNTYYEMHAVLTAQYTYAAVLTPFKPVE